jgi:hypothetical protein
MYQQTFPNLGSVCIRGGHTYGTKKTHYDNFQSLGAAADGAGV